MNHSEPSFKYLEAAKSTHFTEPQHKALVKVIIDLQESRAIAIDYDFAQEGIPSYWYSISHNFKFGGVEKTPTACKSYWTRRGQRRHSGTTTSNLRQTGKIWKNQTPRKPSTSSSRLSKALPIISTSEVGPKHHQQASFTIKTLVGGETLQESNSTTKNAEDEMKETFVGELEAQMSFLALEGIAGDGDIQMAM